MIELTDEYRESARKFRKNFGYGVPLKMIPSKTDTQELIKLIDLCVVNNKDDLLEKLGVIDKEEYLY